jgi:hypothetical protein
MHDLSVHLRAIALADDIDAAAIDHVKVLLKAPEPQIHVPPLVAAATPAAMYVERRVAAVRLKSLFIKSSSFFIGKYLIIGRY